MIGNLFGLLAVGYLFSLFIVMFLAASLYRFYILPYLGKRKYPNKAAYRRVTEYRQICRAEKLLRNDSNPAYLLVMLLKKFESVSLRHTSKVIFGWAWLAGISLIFVVVGI